MRLTQLTLARYRNLNPLELSPEPGISVFVGRNAQGKTNIVESVYFCCTARSHRTTHDKELIRWEEDNTYLRAETLQRDGRHLVEIGLNSTGKKMLKVNGLPARRLGELMGHVNAVMFAPEDLSLVKAGPAVRRRFLDMDMSQTDANHFYDLQVYQKALNQRNTLLKQISFNPKKADQLDVWDAQLAPLGARIVLRRKRFARELFERALEAHTNLTHGERLEARYMASLEAEEPAQAQQELLDLLAHSHESDIRRGATAHGPHRDDFTMLVNGYDLRLYGSQGQHRSAALSLKLAELAVMAERTGEMPILILDDVLSELDERRREGLLKAVEGVQTLLTCVKIEDEMRAMKLNIYDVFDGQVRQRASK